jgi:hypothetical protein
MPPLIRPRSILRALSVVAGLLALGVAGSLAPARGRADSGLHSYALVIGSNRGGAGQGQLAFAEHDAARVADLLRELGRTPREHIQLLAEPTSRDVETALGALRSKLVAHAQAGERAQLLFYYSGHARAHALSLGDEELPLASLRASLLALPSTLTVVVLDACQSGAFSGVKGASAAGDFSISSVRDLNSSGVAVMASSTGSELSQESSELKSSYFTHHLLVSLRGAGDLDRNGRVSLDEAYSYAYQHTLSDTARTQVGSQHATLETELTGRGDVPLSYPVDADAQLALPSGVSGRVLVQRANGGAVMAELVKAAAGALLLALPSGDYDVLVRDDHEGRSCALRLAKGQVHTLSLAACEKVALPSEHAKVGFDAERLKDGRLARESWFLEAGFHLNFVPNDAYVRTLQRFDYDPSVGGGLGPDVALGVKLHPNLSLLARYTLLERGQADRSFSSTFDDPDFKWRTQTMMAGLRLRLPLAGRWLVGFAEFDAGLAFAHSKLKYKVSEGLSWTIKSHDAYDRALALRALAGVTFNFARHFGLYLGAGYTHAPALENELGQRHQSGGVTVVSGMRMNGVKGWW